MSVLDGIAELKSWSSTANIIVKMKQEKTVLPIVETLFLERYCHNAQDELMG